MYIYLIRHTTPQIEKGICYGQSDLDVKDTFLKEAAEIQKLLPQLEEIPLYSSPLQRCKKLAEYFRKEPLFVDTRLKEMNFGDWEMKPWANIEPEAFNRWMNHFVDTAPPNGESSREIYERVMAFWQELLDQNHEETGIFTHFGVIQSLLAHLLHIPLDKTFRLDVNYGGVVRVELRGERFCKVKFLK